MGVRQLSELRRLLPLSVARRLPEPLAVLGLVPPDGAAETALPDVAWFWASSLVLLVFVTQLRPRCCRGYPPSMPLDSQSRFHVVESAIRRKTERNPN